MAKTAMVTGAASGLGFEFSKILASEGYSLVLVDRNGPGLDRARQQIEAESGASIQTIITDMGVPGASGLLADTIAEWRPDVFINNAGFGLYGPFAGSRWEIEASMLNLHIMNLTHLTKLVLEQMLPRGSGRILNVSSLAGFQPGPLFSVYAASKAYINSFSRSVSNELKGTGITMTLLCPGQTGTNFAREVAALSQSPVSRVPLTASAAFVAAYGYHAMMKGKTTAIPGIMNKVTVALSRLLPTRWVTALNRRIQERIRNR